MDGLVIDSEPSFIFAWRQAATAFGVHLEDGVVTKLLGLQSGEVESALQQAIGGGFDKGRFRLLSTGYWREYVNARGIPAMPGLGLLLEFLDRNRTPYALATNTDGHIASECLRLSGLEKQFPLRVTRDQVTAGKPEPDLFLTAARRLGVLAKECIVLEDSDIGLIAASRAGMTPVLVTTKTGPHPLASITFQSLNELVLAIDSQSKYSVFNIK